MVGDTCQPIDSEQQYAEGWTAGYKKCEDAQIAQLMKIP